MKIRIRECKTDGREMRINKYHSKNGAHAAHYGVSIVNLCADFNLREDYDNPRTHTAYQYRRGLGERKIRVIVDHNATGTGATGTGDTVVRSVPRGWKSGDRTFAESSPPPQPKPHGEMGQGGSNGKK